MAIVLDFKVRDMVECCPPGLDGAAGDAIMRAMHELPVTQDILRIALDHAQGAQVTEIVLVIGDLTSFIDEAIQFYFDQIAPGTVAEGARLVFKRVPVRFRCRACGTEFTAHQRDWHCPTCSALGGEILAGKEFYIESISVLAR